MTETQRSRAARPVWQKRLTKLWAATAVLAVLSRISYRASWPMPVTATLLVLAIILALALLVRRIVAAVRERGRS
ncbi:hypothetical protein [Arthrobacter sp. JSM 101049]|uniref:hypothetical protein n=1 Tax=Arthrobacter sp. JSM 101049 TaxID=929097 RepID=UPI00356891F0